MSVPVMPVQLGVQLTHATAQVIAEDIGVRLLHIKGPALDTTLLQRVDGRPQERRSSDADILAHPADTDRFLYALQQHRFELVTHFETGSAFEHAASLWHEQLGWLDVHRRFPGLGIAAGTAFERLWSDHQVVMIGGYRCATPSLVAQRLILLLHAARGGGARRGDVTAAWTDASEQERAAVAVLAEQLSARVGLAAATGDLESYADHPEYELWRHFSTGEENRLGEWRARFRAAPNQCERLRLVLRAARVNKDAMTMRMHRAPTKAEVVREYGRRARVAISEFFRDLRDRWFRR